MTDEDPEDKHLRSAALKSAQSILAVRQQVERELRQAKDALEEQTRVLEILSGIGAKLASTLDLKTIVQEVTDAGTRVSGAQFGAFFYAASNADGGVFTLYTLSGASREAFETFGHPRATELFAPTFHGTAVIRSANITDDPRYGRMAPYFGLPPGHPPVSSYLAVPVRRASGEVIGGLFFGHAAPDVFSESAERLVVGIAAQAAIAIDNGRLYADATRAAEAERQARAEVERVSLLKDEFLATISHELRTPLNAVLGWAELLLSSTPGEVEIKRGLETIARNARAQAQLIEDLLDMNRIVAGKVRLEVQELELAAVIEAAIETVRPSADARSIAIRTTLDRQAGPVFGDPHRVQQIAWNLLSNAVKFTPKGGKIDVLLRRSNSHVEIVIADTGMGIGADFLPFVFERFRQADASSTRRFGGLGLGLAIVKQLAELHGGNVRAESSGVDLGSTFIVSLPVRAIRELRAQPIAAAVQPVPVLLDGLRVLVVDDEVDARDVLEAVLTGAGAAVLLASSADEALEMIRTTRPDLLVSDIGMPDCDGHQLIRRVRMLPIEQGGKTAAIALTAFARSEDRTRSLLAGYQAHVTKPIEAHELIVTIASLTGRTG